MSGGHSSALYSSVGFFLWELGDSGASGAPGKKGMSLHCYSRPRAPHPKYVKKASPPLQMVACLTRDHHGVQYWTKMQDVCTYLYSWWRLWHRLGSKVPICVPTGPGIFRTSKVTLRDPLKHHHIRRVRRGEGIPLEPGGGVWARPKWERLLPLHPVLPGLPSVYSSPLLFLPGVEH